MKQIGCQNMLGRNMLKLVILSTVFSLSIAQAGRAQTQFAPTPPVSATVAPDVEMEVIDAPSTSQTSVDESALRYYAEIRDYDKLAAEIRRLQSLYPEWVPPTKEELFSAKAYSDETPLWDLFEAGDYQAVRQELAVRKQKNPSYQPSEELLTQLSQAELRLSFKAASDAKNWTEVISISQQEQAAFLFKCSAIDNSWRLAEAYVQSGNKAASAQLYQGILKACPNFDERLVTLQIASQNLSGADLQNLIDIEQKRSSGNAAQLTQLAEITTDLKRGDVAKNLGGERKEGFSQEDLTAFIDYANATKDAESANLLGWYYYRSKNYSKAETWFEKSHSWQKSARNIEGLMLVDMAQGQLLSGEARAQGWLKSKAVRKNYKVLVARLFSEGVDPNNIPASVSSRIESYTKQYRDSSTATSLGWWYYRQSDKQRAQYWFEQALSWNKTEKSAAEGLVILYTQQGETALAQATAQKYGIDLSKLVTISKPGSSAGEKMAEAMKFGHFDQCLKLAQEQKSAGGLNSDLQIMLAWCLVNQKRPTEAVLAFNDALQDPNLTVAQRQDATYGMALAMVNRGMANAAIRMVEGSGMPIQKVTELRAEQLATRANQAMQREEYFEVVRVLDTRLAIAPERRDLKILRAWSLFNMGEVGKAHEIFQTLDKAYSTKETREGLSVTNKAMYNRF